MVTVNCDDCSIIEYTIVCRCLKVTAGEVQAAIEQVEAPTVRDVARSTGAGSGCMACHCTLKKLIAQRRAINVPLPPPPFAIADSSADRLAG